MKILIVAPLKRKISPKITAARPRVIFDLATKLIKNGHRVSVLGTGDSKITGAEIIPVIPRQFQSLGPFENDFYAHTAFLVKMAFILREIGNNYDIIHNHCYPEFINLLVEGYLKTPLITTIHGQMTPELDETFSRFSGSNLVCISKNAKTLAKKTKISAVIYNGVDTDLYSFRERKDDYLLWIGRLARAKDRRGNFLDPKGVRWAIKLAQTANANLFLAGNVEDPGFFKKEVQPHLSRKIRWIGPISPEQSLGKKQVARLMQKARAFLITVNWQEPFGLVMAEAQSCGTPVIGFDRGAVKELVADKKTGFVVPCRTGLSGLLKALSRISDIEPIDCRRHIEKNFSLDAMTRNYELEYEKIITAKKDAKK